MSSLQNRQFRDNIKGIGYNVPPKEESQQLDESTRLPTTDKQLIEAMMLLEEEKDFNPITGLFLDMLGPLTPYEKRELLTIGSVGHDQPITLSPAARGWNPKGLPVKGVPVESTKLPTDNQLTEDDGFRRSIKVWGEIWTALGLMLQGWMEKYPPEGETPGNIAPQTPGSKPKGKGSGQSIPGGPQA